MEKFIKPRLLTPSGQSHKKFWQAVGLCALTAAIFFLPFYLLDGGFFHYAGDFNSQQISFYRYMNGFVKGAGYPDSAFAGAPRNTFSWATDLGSGVMNAYSFYLYGSPFFWLSVLLPQSWLPYMMVPLLVLRWRMNLLTLGEEEAQSMGVNTRRLRGAVIVCATLLTSASVAVSGMIGWVGLVIPHFCRMLFGYDYRRLIPAGALFGAAFLLAVDDIARLVTTGELPLGILTAFVGAPLFLYLIATGGGRRVH